MNMLSIIKAVAFAEDAKHDARGDCAAGRISIDEFAFVVSAAERVRQIACSNEQPQESLS